tara:strand:- start:255 stop:497 length:243 start_codon:yes stop_codon:yes gene_type:complete
MTIFWNTGAAAERARHNLKLKKNKMKYIDLDFVKPNKDCTQGCDNITDNAYVCFECEHIQIKEKYPNSKYTNDCEWVIYE